MSLTSKAITKIQPTQYYVCRLLSVTRLEVHNNTTYHSPQQRDKVQACGKNH